MNRLAMTLRTMLLLFVSLLGTPSLGAQALEPVGSTQESTGPQLTLVEGVEGIFEFGRVDQGENLTHNFDLISSGDAPVILTKVKPSCGCLLASVQRWDDSSKRFYPFMIGSKLRPGQKIRIRAQVKTDGRTGPLKTQINIRTNASRGDMALALNADVRALLEVSPQSFLDLGNQPSTADLAASFVVTAPRLGKFDLTVGSRGNSKGVESVVVPLGELENGKTDRWRVDIRIASPAQGGHKEGRRTWMLMVQTKSRLPLVGLRNFERHITIQANVKGKVSVQPEFVSFGMIDRSVRRTLESTITVHDGQALKGPIEVTLIPHRKDSDVDYEKAFDARVVLSDDGLSAQVQIELVSLPEDFVGSLSGIAQVSLGHPERPVVQISFSALVRGDL